MSSKNSINDVEEEEKHTGIDEEKLVESYASYLFGQLTTIDNEQAALFMIKKMMLECRNHEKLHMGQNKDRQKKKASDTKKLVHNFVQKMVKDSTILKSAVRKFVEREKESSLKVQQFDNLKDAYLQLQKQNEDLKKNYLMLRFRNGQDISDLPNFSSHNYNNYDDDASAC